MHTPEIRHKIKLQQYRTIQIMCSNWGRERGGGDMEGMTHAILVHAWCNHEIVHAKTF